MLVVADINNNIAAINYARVVADINNSIAPLIMLEWLQI